MFKASDTESNMICSKWLFLTTFSLAVFILSTSNASSPYYDTISNLTHTCNISPRVVCVDINANESKACVDPQCLIYSGGNISLCKSPLITTNLTTANGTKNVTGNNSTNTTNSTINVTTQIEICNATWIYPSNNKSFCFNSSSWNKTVCNKSNVTCDINTTQCTLNPVVYFGGFFNLKDKDGYGNIPAAELAINQINNDNKTLENITLSLVAKQSTQSLLSYGTKVLYDYLHSGPTKLMLLLPQENDIARTVAAYAGLKQWGTLQFSYGTKDNSLASDKVLFPRFYRLNPLTITYNRIRAAFVDSFSDWHLDVGLLYYADSYYEEVNDDLNQRLKDRGINVVANVGFKSDPAEALNILKEKNAHVILTTFPYWYGKKMFCKAFQLGMYGPHYVWITFTLMPYKFWIPNQNDDLECSEDEMTCIAENHFSFYGATIYKPSNLLIGETNVTFSETYNDLINSTKNRTSVAPYVYDATWTMADILKRARPEIEKKGKTLANLSYGEETELLERKANETDFMGVTGRVRFYKNGNRKFSLKVLQIRRNGFGYIVGSYTEDKDSEIGTYKIADDILWQGFKKSEGGWPYRRTTTTYQWRYIELGLFIAWCILAALGMIYAIFCLVFVIKYRRERSIRFSSPTINVFIILGCLLNFIAVVLYGVDYQRASESRMTIICKARVWIFSLGFTFCIGGLWVKVWTLYQILIERKVYKKRKMEYWMFGIVMVFLVIDVIYLTTWTAIDGLYRSFETVTDQPEYECFQKLSGNPFIATIWYIEICDCDNLTLWSAIFLIYKILLLLFGAYMSWKVRKVFTRKLVDAQYCATLLLLAVPFCVLGLIFAYTIRLYPTPHYGLVGIIIIIYSYIVLGFLYGHKIINIFCCPRNLIKVRSKDENGKVSCCSGVIAACCVSISGCLSALTCCCICCPFNCCKVLWNALIHGPKKNRRTSAKENEKLDYQIGDMPGDREKQIIILQKEVEKREEELKRLRRDHRATLAAKETQTMDYFDTNNGGHLDYGCVNEGFMEENNNKRGTGRHSNNRFKVFHRKLDFSHVGSRVDSGLDSKSSSKRDIKQDSCNEPRRGSNDSDMLMLQKTLSERDKELAQLRAYLGMDPASSTELSSKIGSLESIGEEQDLNMPSEGEVPNRNVSSVAITIKSSDSDGESKKTDSDMSNDEVPSDVNKEQSAGLLGKPKTTEDQAIQMGIFPDKEAAPENTGQKNNPNQEFGKKPKSKVLNSAYGSLMLNGAYVSHYNAKGGKFKKTVRQLNSFGIFSKNRTGDENIPKVEISTSNSPAPNVDETFNNNQTSVDSNEKATTAERSEKDVHDGNAKNKTSNDNTKSNVKIFNAPTNWSHVKSRLFDPNGNAQNTLKTSTNMEQKSKDDGSQNTDEKIRNGAKINAPSDYSHVKSRLFDSNGSESQTSLKQSPSPRRKSKDDGENSSGEADAGKKRNGVKIFNAPSNYSHVKSRLLDPNGSESQTNLKSSPSPSPRRKSKVGIEDNDGENGSGEADAGKKRNGVKIFNSPSNYSHVKSRLLDPNGSESQTNLKPSPSPSPRRKSKVGIEDNDGENSSGEADAGKKRNGVKIFNSSLDYSHVKSRIFDANANQTNSENLLKPTSNLRRKSKVGIEDDGEESSDELSKSRASVKIFNAPSNYSHVKSKLFDSDKPSNKQSSQVNTQDNDEAKKQENEPGQGKENQLSKSRNNVKILNAPSDYSHVRSRLYDSSNKIKNKVQAINALKSTSERADQNAKNKEASTNL